MENRKKDTSDPVDVVIGEHLPAHRDKRYHPSAMRRLLKKNSGVKGGDLRQRSFSVFGRPWPATEPGKKGLR
jgi:hypothetical protein